MSRDKFDEYRQALSGLTLENCDEVHRKLVDLGIMSGAGQVENRHMDVDNANKRQREEATPTPAAGGGTHALLQDLCAHINEVAD